LIFLGQTVLVCQSYNGGLWSPPQRACTEKSKLLLIIASNGYVNLPTSIGFFGVLL